MSNVGTNKTTKTTSSTKKENVGIESVDIEKEQLKNELAELKAQMAIMAQMMANNNIDKSVEQKKEERYIKFVNMTRGGFTLKGSSTYRIPKQFGYRSFLEREAQIIVNNMGNAIRQGYLYIADAEFVEKNQLKDVYTNLLSDIQLEELLKKDASYVVEVYKNVSEGQRSIILGMIENKKLNNEKIDANILMEIGHITNKDLINIEPLDDEEG